MAAQATTTQFFANDEDSCRKPALLRIPSGKYAQSLSVPLLGVFSVGVSLNAGRLCQPGA